MTTRCAKCGAYFDGYGNYCSVCIQTKSIEQINERERRDRQDRQSREEMQRARDRRHAERLVEEEREAAREAAERIESAERKTRALLREQQEREEQLRATEELIDELIFQQEELILYVAEAWRDEDGASNPEQFETKYLKDSYQAPRSFFEQHSSSTERLTEASLDIYRTMIRRVWQENKELRPGIKALSDYVERRFREEMEEADRREEESRQKEQEEWEKEKASRLKAISAELATMSPSALSADEVECTNVWLSGGLFSGPGPERKCDYKGKMKIVKVELTDGATGWSLIPFIVAVSIAFLAGVGPIVALIVLLSLLWMVGVYLWGPKIEKLSCPFCTTVHERPLKRPEAQQEGPTVPQVSVENEVKKEEVQSDVGNSPTTRSDSKMLLVLLILLVGGAAAFWYLSRLSQATQNSSNLTSSQQTRSSAEAAVKPEAPQKVPLPSTSDASNFLNEMQVDSNGYIGEGHALIESGKLDDAIALFDRASAQIKDDGDVHSRQIHLMALMGKAYALRLKGETNEELKIFTESGPPYADDQRPEVRFLVSMILVRKALLLESNGRLFEAMPILEGVERDYADDPNLKNRPWIQASQTRLNQLRGTYSAPSAQR